MSTSAGSRRFRAPGGRIWEGLAVLGAALAVTTLAAIYFYRGGFILYYGDAQAHLNISRGILDSRTPGYDELGSVWLPVLHVICLPFVQSDWLWSTGLAGTIPVGCCLALAVTAFYFAAREHFQSRVPAAAAALCFLLNPNVLYLGSTPMTEDVFLAGVAAMLLALVRYQKTQEMRWVWMAAAGSVWASLTRYDGWFLIPFVALSLFMFGGAGRVRAATLFTALALLAPVYWVGHNQFVTGDALSFYNGPYSAKAIYLRGLAAGQPHDPGDGHWWIACRYYFAAGRLCTGWPLVMAGCAGAARAIWKRRLFPIAFLVLTPCFYIWSMHSSGNPIHVPNLWPFSWYNTRYGIAAVPLCAFAAGEVACLFPVRLRRAGFVVPAIAVVPWLVHFSPERWICWKESQVNSASRRMWTAELAAFMKQHYRSGQGILYAEGDIPGIFCRARIPLKETLNPGNGPAYLVNAYRPDLVRSCQWAIVIEADRDPLARLVDRANWRRTVYAPVLEIHTKDDPVIRLYRKTW